MNGRLGCFFEIETNLFCESESSGRMHALGDQFIEIKIAWLERILPGVCSRKRKEILDDVRKPLGFLVKHAQRFAVLLQRTRLLRKSNLRFTAQNRNRRAQLVRGISHETALAFE